MQKDHVSRYKPREGYGKVDPSLCRASVWHALGNWGQNAQCSRKAKGGTEWCGIHSLESTQRRRDKQEKKWKEEREYSDAEWRASSERRQDAKRVTWMEENSTIFSSDFMCGWEGDISLRKHLDDLMKKENTDDTY